MISVDSPESRTSVSGAPPAVRLGVVLCGGASRRMGEDKARLELDGRTLLEHALRTLSSVCPAVVLAVGERDRYEELGVPRVLDREPGLGPLAGLESALAHLFQAGGELLCVLACDMPRANAEVFRALLTRIEATGADLCLARTEDGMEPLLGVYRRTALDPIRRALTRGDLALRSIHPDLSVEFLDLGESEDLSDGDPTANLNTPADLRAE